MDKRAHDEQFLSYLEDNLGIILRVARIYAFTDQDRKDLVNDIILELWKSYPLFRGECKVSTWIYQIALNTSLNAKRKKVRSKLYFYDDLSIFDQCPDQDEGYDQADRDLLYSYISELDELNKAIIILYLDEYTYEEISRITGLSQSNVGTRLNRIKDKFKQINSNNL